MQKPSVLQVEPSLAHSSSIVHGAMHFPGSPFTTGFMASKSQQSDVVAGQSASARQGFSGSQGGGGGSCGITLHTMFPSSSTQVLFAQSELRPQSASTSQGATQCPKRHLLTPVAQSASSAQPSNSISQ